MVSLNNENKSKSRWNPAGISAAAGLLTLVAALLKLPEVEKLVSNGVGRTLVDVLIGLGAALLGYYFGGKKERQ